MANIISNETIEYVGILAKLELSEEDKLTVCRARRVKLFLSQNMFIGGQFTGIPGAYVPVSETVRGFKEILDGKHDNVPEEAFRLVGTIDDVLEKAKGLVK